MNRYLFLSAFLSFSIEQVNPQIKNTDSTTNADQLIRIEQNLMDAIALGDTTTWSQYFRQKIFYRD